MRVALTIRTACTILTQTLLLSVALAQTSTDQMNALISALRNREFEKALTLVDVALKESPNDPQLWAMQGAAYSGKGHQKEALSSFRTALRISPDYLPALHGAAQIEYDAGSREAVPLLQRVLRLRPADPTGHAMLAVLEYRQGNCTVAAEHFEKAGAMLDSQLVALHAYATCLVRLKRLDEAARVFLRAISLQPEDPQQRRLLASIQLMNHKPQDAVATLQPLVEQNPSSETLELASSAYEDAQDTAEAVSALQQAILLDPQNISLYLDFAQICFAHASFQVGINVVSDGIEQRPDSAQLYFARGVLYVQVADYEKAEADLVKAYQLDPNESLTAAAQGLLAVQQNDLDRAMRDVREKLKSRPHDPLLLYLQADVLTQKGAEPGTADFQIAMQSAKKAVALRPTLAAARAVLAKLYLQSGKNQEAAEQCRKALEIDPKDQASLYRLIQALRKTGETEQVPELLKRLALLRQESAKQQKQNSRYKLVEGDAQP
jgi:tetratricopeptide (TPR) repeat protein